MWAPANTPQGTTCPPPPAPPLTSRHTPPCCRATRWWRRRGAPPRPAGGRGGRGRPMHGPCRGAGGLPWGSAPQCRAQNPLRCLGVSRMGWIGLGWGGLVGVVPLAVECSPQPPTLTHTCSPLSMRECLSPSLLQSPMTPVSTKAVLPTTEMLSAGCVCVWGAVGLGGGGCSWGGGRCALDGGARFHDAHIIRQDEQVCTWYRGWGWGVRL